MYKFRDEFPYNKYVEIITRDLGIEIIMSKDEAISFSILNLNNTYTSRQILLNNPLFNSKDYLEIIKRKDR